MKNTGHLLTATKHNLLLLFTSFNGFFDVMVNKNLGVKFFGRGRVSSNFKLIVQSTLPKTSAVDCLDVIENLDLALCMCITRAHN